jgi:hypothetical protein
MDAGDLTREQLEQLKERVGSTQRYFGALQERIQQQRFPYDDALRQAVNAVFDDLHSLWVKLHYLSCNGQCGNRPQRVSGEPRAVYRLQIVATPDAPFSPQYIQDVDAETPLEAIIKLARHGYLKSMPNPFWVRVVLLQDSTGAPTSVLTVEISTDLVRPHAK